jgi:hypothetical protein
MPGSGVAKSNIPWKNTIATDQTEGAPPKRGSTILVNIGCMAKSRAALRKIAAVYIGRTNRGGARGPGVTSCAMLLLFAMPQRGWLTCA